MQGGGRTVRGSRRACLVDEQCLVRLLLARMVEQQQAHRVARQVDHHQAEPRPTAARGEARPGHWAARRPRSLTLAPLAPLSPLSPLVGVLLVEPPWRLSCRPSYRSRVA